MRLLHTSDWHLGRTLHGVDLLDHQAAHLDHLVEVVRSEGVDAVLVAGDVYDRAVPPVEAVTLLSEAGNGIPQICAVTGHTLQSATRILEKYLAMTPALSKAAILAFENSPATAFANRLQTGPQGTSHLNHKAQGDQ